MLARKLIANAEIVISVSLPLDTFLSLKLLNYDVCDITLFLPAIYRHKLKALLTVANIGIASVISHMILKARLVM